jgi:hypothetical protein
MLEGRDNQDPPARSRVSDYPTSIAMENYKNICIVLGFFGDFGFVVV